MLAGVDKHGRDWVTIGETLPHHRHADRIHIRYEFLCREEAKRNPWSSEEDDRLRDAIGAHGSRDWSIVAQEVKSRNATACVLRWLWLNMNQHAGSQEWNVEVTYNQF